MQRLNALRNFRSIRKVSKFHLLRRNLQHLPFLSRFLLRGSRIIILLLINMKMPILKILLSGPQNFPPFWRKPKYRPLIAGRFLFGLMNNEVHYSAGHYTTFGWLCQQKFSLCAARRGACSDYTEVQWWYNDYTKVQWVYYYYSLPIIIILYQSSKS